MEMEKEKSSCGLWFSLPDVKVSLKQLSEIFLKNSYPWKFMSLEKHLLPNFTVAFVDIF